MKEFVTAVEEIVAEDDGTEVTEQFVEFKLDGRVMHAYAPNPGQLAFMLAALGRGQTDDSRFASILNIMFESLRDKDKDHLEARMLSRDPKKRLPMEQIEQIFEFLVEEWFARPTQSSSGSAESQPSDGPN